jgi:hypothetical protein
MYEILNLQQKLDFTIKLVYLVSAVSFMLQQSVQKCFVHFLEKE